MTFNPKLDLVLERVVDVTPEKLWECWTSEKHIPHFFVPKPWTIASCRVDPRPGGAFESVMRSPDGQEFPNKGCFLVVDAHRLVFTDTLEAGYRPKAEGFFTCELTLVPEGSGTRYKAVAMHATEEARQRHEAMGFQEGWGMVLDQLVEYAKTLTS